MWRGRRFEFDAGEIRISLNQRQGVLRLSSSRLFSRAAARHTPSLAACALQLAPVTAVRSSVKGGWVEIDYQPDVVAPAELLLRFSEALRAADGGALNPVPLGVNGQPVLRIVRGESGVMAVPDVELAQGWKRLVFRVLAVSSLCVTVIASVVPAIPTPPFLVATMYFAIRSSPALEHWLERSWMFGRMIADWREHRAVRPIVKVKSILISFTILGLCIVLFDLTGATLYTALAMVALSALIVIMLPSLPESVEEDLPQPMQPVLA